MVVHPTDLQWRRSILGENSDEVLPSARFSFFSDPWGAASCAEHKMEVQARERVWHVSRCALTLHSSLRDDRGFCARLPRDVGDVIVFQGLKPLATFGDRYAAHATLNATRRLRTIMLRGPMGFKGFHRRSSPTIRRDATNPMGRIHFARNVLIFRATSSFSSLRLDR